MAPGPANPNLFRFGAFELDSRTGELRKDGFRIKLAGQPIAILAMLLTRPGELVTREELQKKLWPDDTFVDFEHSLNTAIKRLRAALNDSAEAPRYVETLPGRGYRFIGETNGAASAPPEVSVEAEQSHAAPALPVVQARSYFARWPFILAVLLVLAITMGGWLGWQRYKASSSPAARIRSLAVLPLENLSGDSSQEYFADGMTDALITNLAQINALRVISRTSAMRYKASKKSLPEIAQELHVDGIVEGSVVRIGDRVRITAQLIDAHSDQHLWAATYERGLRDVLSLQDEVARDISGEIRVKLTPSEHERLVTARPIDPEAYQLYLKAVYDWNRRTEEGNQAAIEYTQAAIRKDPDYAPAYATLAIVYTARAIFGWSASAEVIPKAKANALKALEIDDRLAQAHATLGIVTFQYEWDWAAGEKHLERAVALDPVSPSAHFICSLYFSALGRVDRADAEAQRQLDLDPVSPTATFQLGMERYRTRRFDVAIEQAQVALKLDPQFPLAYWLLGEAYLAKGMPHDAVQGYQMYAALSHRSARSLGYLGLGLARAGKRREALGVLEELRSMSKQSYVSAYYFALVYSGLGEKSQALSWLEKACDERSGQVAFLNVEAEWDALRQEPRFKELLHRIGLS